MQYGPLQMKADEAEKLRGDGTMATAAASTGPEVYLASVLKSEAVASRVHPTRTVLLPLVSQLCRGPVHPWRCQGPKSVSFFWARRKRGWIKHCHLHTPGGTTGVTRAAAPRCKMGERVQLPRCEKQIVQTVANVRVLNRRARSGNRFVLCA